MTNEYIYFVRPLNDRLICVGYIGYISVSFKGIDWKNALLYSDGSYTKPNYYDVTGLYV